MPDLTFSEISGLVCEVNYVFEGRKCTCTSLKVLRAFYVQMLPSVRRRRHQVIWHLPQTPRPTWVGKSHTFFKITFREKSNPTHDVFYA